jgi:hypothetical protein
MVINFRLYLKKDLTRFLDCAIKIIDGGKKMKYKIEYRQKGNPNGKTIASKKVIANSFAEALTKRNNFDKTWYRITREDGKIITLEDVRNGLVKV